MPVYRILMSSRDDARSECERAGEIVRRVGEDYLEEVSLELVFHRNHRGAADSFSVENHQAFDLVICLIDEKCSGNGAASGAGVPTNANSDGVATAHTTQIGRIPDFLLFAKESETIGETPAAGSEGNNSGWNALERFVKATLPPASIAIAVPKNLKKYSNECCAKNAVNAPCSQPSTMSSRREKR